MTPRQIAMLSAREGASRKDLLPALQEVRGSHRVTSQNPEEAYQALEKYGRDLERFEQMGGYTVAPRIDAVLDGLGFNAEKARVTPLSGLSGGERGRLALAGQLVSPADVLLLDEPTNHLDLDTTRWLEEYLQEIQTTIILISHDRAFLSAVVDHVLHLEGHTSFAYAGGYEDFVEQRNLRRLTEQRPRARRHPPGTSPAG